MPRLASDSSRYVLEEAVPGPTDVSPANPGVSKLRYNVDVAIEGNDMLFTLRSDNASILADVVAWFGGSNTLQRADGRLPGLGWLPAVHVKQEHVHSDGVAEG